MDNGLKLKQLRTEKKLDQKQLSELSGISREMISLYERNGQPLSMKSIIKFCEVFEITPDYFLKDNSEKLVVKSETITEKLFDELRSQIEYFKEMLKLESEKNTRLSKTLENLSSNFQEGNGLYSSPIIGEAVILKAA